MGETGFFVHDQLGLSADIRSDGSSWASRNLLSLFANWMPSGPVAHYHRQITFQGIYRNQMWEPIDRTCFSGRYSDQHLSKRFCGSSRSYGRSHHQRQRETFDVYIQKQPTEGV